MKSLVRGGWTAGINIFFGFIFLNSYAYATPSAEECAPSSSYLEQVKRAFFAPDRDYSCLTDLVSLGPKIASYQLIDTRSEHSPDIANAWVISFSELKNKAFLHNKQILLLPSGFSRADAATNCAELKKAGFISAKILLGGADLWISNSSPSKTATLAKSVSPREFLFEYFNAHITIISTSRTISAELTSLGFTSFVEVNGLDHQQINDAVVNKTRNGYDPAVIITRSPQPLSIPAMYKTSNLYFLAGGINGLKGTITENVLSDINRNKKTEGTFCARK